ncbi:LLM class F420-dependent oxidoreductase [Actinomadura sp. HBU206391]|uniref:LLM class F420-dependent oxidoreductase n=1 Tax=Actinomadura sp. HBU206391 TaxID=2731692 RepID=UPI002905E4D0|nr:LLM class F420-dependent oxidoreductase [Actinomadura sp. HBU206391]
MATFVTDEGIAPARLGCALEERGFESVFVAEHTHIPVKRESQWPEVDELPRKYYRTFDPFVTLTAAAVVTERLLVGTGVLLLVERDPITTAKEIASLDHVSGGRIVVGVGAGWNREEMRDHGTDPKTRTALLRERVLAMKEIWAKDQAEFHGSFVDFDPIFCWPKPVQRPHPPIIMGGNGPRTLDRVLEYGDGWMPTYGLGVDEIARRITELERRAVEAGRARIPVSVYAVPGDHEIVARLADVGADQVLFDLPTLPLEETCRTLDELAAVARSFTP